MKKTMIIAASILALAVAAPVLASSDDKDKNYHGSGNIEWMSKDSAKAKATEQGYDVRRVKRNEGYYEIYAFDKNGMQVEIYLHPSTGKIIRVEKKF
jgi:hypothetical protein